MAKGARAEGRGAMARWLTPEGLALMRARARDGWDDARLAEGCGVSTRTLLRWKKDSPEIAGALAASREGADVAVEDALHALAVGYTRPVRKTYRLKRVEYDERGRKAREWEDLETGVDEVHVPGNVTAQKFWLAHRRPGAWGDDGSGLDSDGPVSVIDDIARGDNEE